MDLESIKGLYLDYLNSPSLHAYSLCDSCGWFYSHPLNYCCYCPGRIIKTHPVVIDHMRSIIRQNGYSPDFMAGFGEFYKIKTSEEFPWKDFEYEARNYSELSNVRRFALGKPQIDLDLYYDGNTPKEFD